MLREFSRKHGKIEPNSGRFGGSRMMHVSTTPPLDLAKHLAQEFMTRADEADTLGQLPAEDVQALQESGYLGLSVPKAYGGQELTLNDCLAAHLELAQGSASTAMVAGMPLHIFGYMREVRVWSDKVFERLGRASTNGGLINNVASEPLLGSPSRGGLPATTASPNPDGGGWVINGQKTWSTGGRHLTHMLVTARLDDKPALLLVLQDTPGVEWVETWSDSLSLRASDSHDVFFKNVVVPSDHLIQQGAGQTSLPPSAWFPMVMSTVYLGAAIAARNAIITYALERAPTALGKPIATLPKIQRQIGEIDLTLQAAKALLFEVAGQWTGAREHWQGLYPRVVAAKVQVIEAANEVTEKALRVAGGMSITKALPLERHFRDVRAGSMQPPSGDTALEIIGRHAIEQVKSQHVDPNRGVGSME
jgi:alkylation response protein AidB-like acyl-CoA dehydrogenase